MSRNKTLVLSWEALEILRAGWFDDAGRYHLPSPHDLELGPPPPAVYREIKTAMTSLGWNWDRDCRAYIAVPDPRTALAAAIVSGEVTL